MEKLTQGEMTIFVGSIVFGLIVFAATVAGIIYFFKRIAHQDRAEEERYSEPAAQDSKES